MNETDYNKNKFSKDSYGNLIPKTSDNKISYRGFTIEKCIGHVKVWDSSDNFFGEYPDVKSAKKSIKAFLTICCD